MLVFLALTERFDLVPAEFLVIPLNGHNVGCVGNPLGLGPPLLISRGDDFGNQLLPQLSKRSSMQMVKMRRMVRTRGQWRRI
jgi:hypothetical protein